MQPHRGQPTRLPHPWDSPGKNTGMGCHFLLQCMKVRSESEVAKACPTLSNPMDSSLSGASILGISQARVLEWVAIAFSPHPYMTTGKTIALTRRNFVGKIMSLLFIMLSRREGNGNPLQCSYLENPRDGGAWWASIYGVAQSRIRLKRLSTSSSSRLVMPFLPRSKRLLVSWLQSPSAVILEPKIIKVFHCFHCFPICFP